MSDTTASLRRKIGGAGDLQSVVRTMKAVAASSIGQYEKSMSTLADYYCTVELGLDACFRASGLAPLIAEQKRQTVAGAVVFGSDQGLVGQFNAVVADYAVKTSAALPDGPLVRPAGGRKRAAIGQRMPYLFMINWRRVCPLFYHDRDRFINVMRSSIALNGSFFNTQRMMLEYVLRANF